MKKYLKYLLTIVIIFFTCIKVTNATTIRETLVNGDGFDTIAPNTFIIGITKFTGDQVITASKAATAGANDALFYALKNGTTKGYVPPVIYYYVDANVGWFQFDSNNTPSPVTDEETLAKLSNIDIYYVNNVEKKLSVSYPGNDLDLNELGDGISYENNTLFIDATKLKFDITTTEGKTISYIIDETTSTYTRDTSMCYTVNSGIITDYDETCGSDIIIPAQIDGTLIIGIGDNAFNGKNLESVTIPKGVVSIGNNAFANNDNLSVVMLDGKYDNSDFSNIAENAFPNNIEINYQNDLTRAIDSLPKEYTIKVYQDMDIDNTFMGSVIINEVFKEINTENYSFHIEKSEIDKFYFSHYYLNDNIEHNECRDYSEGSFDMSFMFIRNDEFYIYFSKKLENCTREIYVNRKIKVNYERTGTATDKYAIENAFRNLQKYDSNEEYGSDVVTNRTYLEDFVDNNHLDYLFDSSYGQAIDPKEGEQIGGSITKGQLLLFKDDILYQKVEDIAILNLSNSYFTNYLRKDFPTTDAYIESVVNDFKTKTGVTNYTLLHQTNYKETISGVRKYYYIDLFDTDKLEYWTIYSSPNEVTEDNYDTNGLTKEMCFTVNDGTITKYDGSCGANVKIPERINNQEIHEIGTSAFYNYGIQSIQLPSKLVKISNSAFYSNKLKRLNIPILVTDIGWNAFANNELEELLIPSNVTTIEGLAFRNNKIETLQISNYLTTFGDGAFTNNQLDDDHAFIYNRNYNPQTERDDIDTTRINSYAGRKRTNITIPSTVKTIGDYSFQGLGIESITIPNGIINIGTYAFSDNKLTSMSLPNTINELGWGVFSNNKFTGENAYIYFRKSDDTIDKTKLGAFSPKIPKYSYEYKTDKLELPSTIKKVWNNAFSNAYTLNINELVIPYGVEEIKEGAFSSVIITKPLTIPKSVTLIERNAFNNSFNIGDENAYVYARGEDNIVDKSILMAYLADGNGTELVIPDTVKEIGMNTFSGKNFSSVRFNQILEKIGKHAFSYNYYLTNITLPNSVKIIDDYAFSDCSTLNSLTLNNGLTTIGNYSFMNHLLTTIEIPSTVKTIGKGAFERKYFTDETSTLNNIILNNGIEEIGEDSFNTLTTLDTISIPSSVRIIGNNAFGYVSNVKIYGKTSLDDFENECYLKNYNNINIEFVNE